MNARTAGYLLREKGGRVDYEKSIDGVVVPVPVIFESEILKEVGPVLYWYGDSDNKQREFPLCVSPEFFDKELAADPKCCDIWFVGSLADLRRSRFGTGGYEVRCHREDLQEEASVVCGMISGMTFIFEIVSVGFEWEIIQPILYFKKEQMNPGGVEL